MRQGSDKCGLISICEDIPHSRQKQGLVRDNLLERVRGLWMGAKRIYIHIFSLPKAQMSNLMSGGEEAQTRLEDELYRMSLGT